jgi:hypothetical protein
MMGDTPQRCIICDELVGPKDGGQALGPFPAIHSKCLRRGLNDDEAVPTDAVRALLDARVALGGAVSGRDPLAIMAAIGMLLVDILRDVAEQADAGTATLIFGWARDIGQSIIAAADRETPEDAANIAFFESLPDEHVRTPGPRGLVYCTKRVGDRGMVCRAHQPAQVCELCSSEVTSS